MKKKVSQRLDRILGLVAMALIAAAWYAGGLHVKADITPFLKKFLPQTHQFQSAGADTYAAMAAGDDSQLLGYVKIAQAMGYGGPVTVAVAVDTRGTIIGLGVVDHKDSPTYFEQVLRSDLLKNVLGKTYQDPLALSRDVDAVTGATLSSNAIVVSAHQAVKEIASHQLGLEVPDAADPELDFGLSETILMALFAMGIVARLKGFRFTRILRWASLLTGLVFIGFVYNNPLTIAMINRMLLGFWPDLHTHLYPYLLVGGVMLLFLIEGKNSYCGWFCPFGAAQECLGKISRAKHRKFEHFRGVLKWLQRGAALVAIIGALLLRDPALTSYEVFGTLFQMWGSAFQFSIIALVFLLSLYTIRPWCNYLCPVRPVDEFMRMIKKWMKELWLKSKAY